MEPNTLMRIGAVVFVAIALSVTALNYRDVPRAETETVLVPPDTDGVDPLRAELHRCQALGEAGASDTRCLRAWALQRSRFFLSAEPAANDLGDASANAAPTDARVGDVATNSTSANASMPELSPPPPSNGTK